MTTATDASGAYAANGPASDGVLGAGAGPTASAEPDGLVDERFDPEVLSSERVFVGRVWDVRREVVQYGEAQITRDFVEHPGAVGVLALDDDDRVFLIRQYRHPIGHRDWEIPAGLLDVDGEDPLDAARRELAEEADLVAADWAVLADIFTSPGGNNESIRIYLARGLADADEVFAREDEEADMLSRWVPLDEAVDAVLERRVQNAPLAVAVLAAQAGRSRGWSTLGAADAPWTGRPWPRGDGR
ncbi:NUDIX domain-containing protein [Agromyces sp. CFH 90414]|uniref:NUDIX domain-containing protein n=1 Tax=Agromyces agglutinans TaxID=2662258 RepID=A0A6I2F873_9MICO|nr:NUDIX hydrolase [Agromyces agglutinans]MRG60809.1 NUDIX domain-containing protein [Agromyces agglutinans]